MRVTGLASTIVNEFSTATQHAMRVNSDCHTKCECDTNNYYGLVGCQDFQSYMIPGLWAGLITDEISNKEELATLAVFALIVSAITVYC